MKCIYCGDDSIIKVNCYCRKVDLTLLDNEKNKDLKKKYFFMSGKQHGKTFAMKIMKNNIYGIMGKNEQIHKEI